MSRAAVNRALFWSERGVRAQAWVMPLTMALAFSLGYMLLRLPLALSGSTALEPATLSDLSFLLLFPAPSLFFVTIQFLPVRRRTRDYEQALPISLRDLLLTRFLAVWAGLGLPIVSSLLAVTILLWGRSELSALWVSGGNLIAATLLSAAALISWRPTKAVLSLFEVGGFFALAFGLLALPCAYDVPWIGLAYLAIAGFLLVNGLPSAAAVVREEVEGPVRDAEAAVAGRSFLALSPLAWLLLRSTLLRPLYLRVLISLAIVFALAPSLFLVLCAGVLVPYQYGRIALTVLHGIDSLPVPRSRLLPLVVLPPLVALVAGFLLAPRPFDREMSWDSVSSSVELGHFSAERLGLDGEYVPHLRVPADLWKLHRGPEQPSVTAPWGETAMLLPHPILWGSDLTVYNPYDVSKESTPRFLAWQVERATGRRISEEELQARYSELGSNRRGGFESLDQLAFDAERLLPDLPRPDAAPNRTLFRLGGITLSWIAVMGFLLQRWTPPRDRRAWRRRLALRVAGIALGIAACFFLVVVDGADNALLPVLLSLLHRAIDGAFGSSTLAWLGFDALLLGGGYLWLGRRLQRLETPPVARFGWGRKEISIF